jgi:uncharacterized protein (UPF0333 family)
MISPKTEEEKLKKAERLQVIKDDIIYILKEYFLPLGVVVLCAIILFIPEYIKSENTTYQTYSAEAVVYEKTFTPAHTESDMKLVPTFSSNGIVSHSYIPTTKHVPDSYITKISYNGYTLTLDGEDTYNAYEKGDTVPVNVTETFLRGEFQRGKIELAGEELDNGN